MNLKVVSQQGVSEPIGNFVSVTRGEKDKSINRKNQKRVVYVTAEVIPVSHDQLNLALDNPFRKPYLKGDSARVFRVRSGGRKHELITDGSFNITDYKIGYIKKPTPIDLTTNTSDPVCDLNDNFHRELLQETLEIAKRTVQDPSLALNLNNIKE